MSTEVEYLGLKLKNPIIVGSSGLTGSVSKIKELAKNGAAAVVLKSIFEEEIMLEYQNIIKDIPEGEHLGRYDYYDYKIKQDNVKAYLELIKQAKAAVDIPIIASINCTSGYEWQFFAQKIQETGADAIELNIFIMPYLLDKTGLDNENLYFDIIKKVKAEVSIPVSVKMSYYFSNLGRFIVRLSKEADGLVLFNRFYSPDFDLEEEKIVAGHVLSSKFEMHIPLRWIAMTHGRLHCDVASSTGTHNSDGVIKMILAGAKTVQVVTTLYQHGAKEIQNLLKGLESYMSKKGYNSLEDFRGKLSLNKAENPSAFYRVQFMKYHDNQQDAI